MEVEHHLAVQVFILMMVFIIIMYDIGGTLGPIHYVILKVFEKAMRNGTKYKTCFRSPRMSLEQSNRIS